jgi:hypothetical protein
MDVGVKVELHFSNWGTMTNKIRVRTPWAFPKLSTAHKSVLYCFQVHISTKFEIENYWHGIIL